MSDLNSNKDQTGSLVHFLGLMVGFFGPVLFYFGSDDEFVRANAANATNWQISVTIYSIILTFLSGFTLGIISLFILNVYFSAVAAKKASKGKVWNYPLTISIFDSTNYNTSSTSIDEKEYNDLNDSHIDRIKRLYYKDVIDEEEMERRIEKSLKKSSNKEDNTYKSRNLEYSKN
jgi:uncharacterized Tic20 family protein